MRFASIVRDDGRPERPEPDVPPSVRKGLCSRIDPSSKLRHAGAALGALLATVSVSQAAHAIPDCSTLPSPIYAVGGSSPVPIFAKVAAALAAATPPVTFVYYSAGQTGCTGVTDITTAGTLLTGTANYWSSTGATLTCNLQDLTANPANPGTPPDFGVSGTYASLCGSALPTGFKEFLGPIQDVDYIVPAQSSATSISAAAAYFVYGFGAQTSNPYVVENWGTPANIFTRTTGSTAAIIAALGAGLPVATLSATGTSESSSSNMVTAVGAVTPGAGTDAIGFVSGEYADGNTSSPTPKIKILAYQHTGQSCGWLPSSTPNTYDKINVRNGLYALWSNVHFIAAVDGTGTPTNASAKAFIGYFTGSPPAGIDVDALTAQAGATLDCAMKVSRTSDMGPLVPYTPAAPCGCFFEKNATGVTSCATCATSADCGASAPVCTKGYCEVN